MKTKYIFVTGGVVSGLGKGITAASLGRLLKNRGYKIVNQKFDPYINVDPGTMSPYEHGEVFVTEDGAETDLDLGHYERFTDVSLTRNSSVTTGKIYSEVIRKERQGAYLGKTVQVIPHITNEIKNNIYQFKDQDVDIVITEIGGTVGDIESLPFMEAIRQIGLENDKEDVAYVHVTLLPHIFGTNELKSKPTQHSVKELQSIGIKPDILVCRTELPIPDEMKQKIAMFCNVRKENVIENNNANILYEVPLMLEKQGLAVQVCKHLQLENVEPKNEEWEKLIKKIKNISGNPVKIAIVGKYVRLEDAYLSVVESIKHGGFANNVPVEISFINSETINRENVEQKISKYDGVIVPGGFGNRGIEGKIETIKYVRENNIPFLGICLGMQMAVIEYARNVLNLPDVNSTEISPDCKNPVIHLMNEQKNITKKGGTMRLGCYDCILEDGSLAQKLFKQKQIKERHRHRYEYNNEYKEALEKNGLMCSGKSPDGKLVEMVEIPNHNFFIASQFHPEFTSRPDKPHPLFVGLIQAAKKYMEEKN